LSLGWSRSRASKIGATLGAEKYRVITPRSFFMKIKIFSFLALAALLFAGMAWAQDD
jgi:hypothetical protein